MLLLLLCCLFLGVAPVRGCDDTVLMLVSGANPGDEFAGALLKMGQGLRNMASALNAFNIESAQQNLDQVLQSWVSFDNRYSQTPPFRWKGDPRWTQRVKQLTDLLGVVRANFKAQKYKPTHDMLEGVVIQMTLLSTGAAGARDYEPVLEAEWVMNNLNPSLPGSERVAIESGLSSFTRMVTGLAGSLGSGTSPLLADISSRAALLQTELETASTLATPVQMRLFADLLAAFSRLKGFLWARPAP